MTDAQRKMLKAYKKQLMTYEELTLQLRDFEEKLDKAYYDLAGVKAIQYDKQKGNVNKEFIKKRKFELSELIERLETEVTRLSMQINYIDDVIFRIGDADLRQALIDVYICGKGLRKVSERFNCSHNTLKVKIDSTLVDILSTYYT